jgi:TetR/AcrR family transcriptional repressor of nem operon
MQQLDKRSQLVEAAVHLVHQQGFDRTTLADIAERTRMPLGNLYYYFKTKDAIGRAIVEQRAGDTAALLREWDKLPSPKDRLEAFVDMTFDNRNIIVRSGCPIGTLCAELHKERGPLAKSATRLFSQFLEWIEAQFEAMGCGESRELAEHLLSGLQGASVLTHSFGDPKYIVREARRRKAWIQELSLERYSGSRRRRGRTPSKQ